MQDEMIDLMEYKKLLVEAAISQMTLMRKNTWEVRLFV
jgi:hypothetical protein